MFIRTARCLHQDHTCLLSTDNMWVGDFSIGEACLTAKFWGLVINAHIFSDQRE